jgi:hypothetical protein
MQEKRQQLFSNPAPHSMTREVKTICKYHVPPPHSHYYHCLRKSGSVFKIYFTVYAA